MKKNFIALAEILEVFANAKKQLSKQGIHPLSQSDWLELTDNFSDSIWIQKAQQKVSQYLGIEAQKIPLTQAFLATSDIIESIFGKYKIFASSVSNSEIAVRQGARFPRLGNAHQDNEMILTLVLSTTKLTPDKVLQAMESIHVADINALVRRGFWSIYVI